MLKVETGIDDGQARDLFAQCSALGSKVDSWVFGFRDLLLGGARVYNVPYTIREQRLFGSFRSAGRLRWI